jgi:hypothetical protein
VACFFWLSAPVGWRDQTEKPVGIISRHRREANLSVNLTPQKGTGGTLAAANLQSIAFSTKIRIARSRALNAQALVFTLTLLRRRSTLFLVLFLDPIRINSTRPSDPVSLTPLTLPHRAALHYASLHWPCHDSLRRVAVLSCLSHHSSCWHR